MRKALVFSGPMASGKTWISIGIMNFFPDEYIRLIKPLNSFADLNYHQLLHCKLIVVDECQKIRDITSFETLRKRFPDINFIFCIQKEINRMDTEKYHLVKCEYNPA